MVSWSLEMTAGAILASIVLERDDDDSAISAMAAAAARHCDLLRQQVAAMESQERKRFVQVVAARLRARISAARAEHMPARARMWLANQAPEQLAAGWLADAPQPRRRFRPSKQLLTVLHSMAIETSASIEPTQLAERGQRTLSQYLGACDEVERQRYAALGIDSEVPPAEVTVDVRVLRRLVEQAGPVDARFIGRLGAIRTGWDRREASGGSAFLFGAELRVLWDAGCLA